MTDARHAFTIFCDDVRAEIGNKLSLMGCYDSALLVARFPLQLAKLCFVMTATSPVDRPFQQLKFRVYKNEDLLHELEIDSSQLALQTSQQPAPDVSDIKSLIAMKGVMQISPFIIDEPCYLKVRVVTEEDQPIRGGALQIIGLSPQPSSSPQISIPME